MNLFFVIVPDTKTFVVGIYIEQTDQISLGCSQKGFIFGFDTIHKVFTFSSTLFFRGEEQNCAQSW